jgi:DNA-binding beta-propeller fold protein YncE
MPRAFRFFPFLGAALFAAPLFAQPLVYVTDPSANALKAINSGNNTIVRTVSALTGARALAVSPDGTRVYVAASGTGSNGEVAALDGTKISDSSQNPLIAKVRVGGKPIATAYDARTGLLYVADAKNNQASTYDLSDIDADDPQTYATYDAGAGLEAMALAPDGEVLALATDAPGVTLYNLRLTNAGFYGKSVLSLASKPRALAFSADGEKLWIATSDGFALYSFATGAVTSHPLSGGTTSVAVAPRAGRVYFGAGTGHIVYVYDPGAGSVSQIAVYGPVSGLSLSADGTRLYAAQNCDDCGMAVVTTADGKAIKQVHFGSAPQTAGRFAGPGAIYAVNAATTGAIGEQLSGTVSADDYDKRGLSYAAITKPAAGTLDFNADGGFAYTPPAGFSGVEHFVWQASASGGEGAPVNPVSRAITETLDIKPSISAIGDQKGDPDSTLGPLAFTIAGTKPLGIALKSSNSDLIAADKITVSPGCGETSLACSLTVPVKNVENGNTAITLSVVGPDGLSSRTKFKVTVGNGNNDESGGGGLALPALAGLALLAFICARFGKYRRREKRHG